DLVGIPPARRGTPQIEVTFDIDANGILHVSAKDLGTGKEQSIKITAPTKLSKDEVEKMVKTAESFAEEDKNRHEEAELRNEADSLAYNAERTLKEHGEKVSEDVRKKIEESITVMKEALRGEDLDAIRKAKDELTEHTQKIAEQLYQTMSKGGGPEGAEAGAAAGPGAGASSPGDGGAPNENIVDAALNVEDEKK
ncbi:MAG: Hsp70 family protein, partial [bacterium]